MCSLLGYVIIYVILLTPQPDWAAQCAAGMVESPKNPVRHPAPSPLGCSREQLDLLEGPIVCIIGICFSLRDPILTSQPGHKTRLPTVFVFA